MNFKTLIMSFLKKLFGFGESKPAEKAPAKSAKQLPQTPALNAKKNEQRLWIAESVLQFVASPAFFNDLEDFKEENCINFTDEEESSHQQFLLFKKYTAIMEDKLRTLVTILGVSETEFCDAAYLCYRDPRYKRLMEELFCAEDFQWFKKVMTKKNRQLESLLNKQTGNGSKRQAIEQEQKEFEHALALSKRFYEEYLKETEREEAELQQAILASKLNYEAEINRQKNSQRGVTDENVGDIENMSLIHQKKLETEKRKLEIEQRLAQEREEINAKLKDLQRQKDLESSDFVSGGCVGNGTSGQPKPVNFGSTDGETHASESPEERKARLNKQREALINARKQDRQLQLKQEAEASSKRAIQSEDEREKTKHKQIYEELAKGKVL